MEKSGFYVDSCVYLNLWRKEEGKSFIPMWKLAQDFLEKCEEKYEIIYYSGYVLKELEHVLGKETFIARKDVFLAKPNMVRLFATDEELSLGRKLEAELQYSISFFDIMHMILAKRANATLVTRDRKLISAARAYGAETKRSKEC